MNKKVIKNCIKKWNEKDDENIKELKKRKANIFRNLK